MIPVPTFPDSRELTLEDKPVFDEIFRQWQPDISAYTFTNIFVWREPYSTRLSLWDGLYIVSNVTDGKMSILEPLGDGDKVGAVLGCLQSATDMPTNFRAISQPLAIQLEKHNNLQVLYDRNNADYIYLAQDLIELGGRKYDGKRNFINRFKQKYDYEYIKLSSALAEECHNFVKEWCEDKNCDESEGLSKERCAVYQMLAHMDELGLVGGAISVEGKMIAFGLAEALNDRTLVIHAEKGNTAYDGIYQLVNNQLCIHEAQGFEFVNREQDLGVPGLRKAKESYHPIEFGKIFTASLK